MDQDLLEENLFWLNCLSEAIPILRDGAEIEEDERDVQAEFDLLETALMDHIDKITELVEK